MLRHKNVLDISTKLMPLCFTSYAMSNNPHYDQLTLVFVVSTDVSILFILQLTPNSRAAVI